MTDTGEEPFSLDWTFHGKFLLSLIPSEFVRGAPHAIFTASSMSPMFTMSPSTGRLDGESRKVIVKFDFEFWSNIHFEIPLRVKLETEFYKMSVCPYLPSTFQADELILTGFP